MLARIDGTCDSSGTYVTFREDYVSPVPFTQVIRGTDGRYSCDDARAGRLLGVPYRWVMPWFDLFMMRKQFLNLRRLAEKTAAAAA